MDEATTIQIMLAVLEITLAALAIIIAVVAVFGYNWLSSKAEETARKTAQQALDKFLTESNIRAMIIEEVAREANNLYKDMDSSPTHDLSQERQETEND